VLCQLLTRPRRTQQRQFVDFSRQLQTNDSRFELRVRLEKSANIVGLNVFDNTLATELYYRFAIGD